MGIADFLGMRWVLWEDDQDVERVVDTVMELLRSGIAATPNTAPRRATTSTDTVKRAKAAGPRAGKPLTPLKPAKGGGRHVRG
jgi:hypothetical protein